MKSKLFYLCVAACAGVFSVSQANADQNVHATLSHSKTSFIMHSNENPDETILFSCSALVERTTAVLKALGATDVKVDCMGDNGDSDQPSLNPMVMAEFTAAHLPSVGMKGSDVMATWQTVTLHDFEGCASVRQVLVNLTPSLEVRNFNPQECAFKPDGAYKFQLDTLVAK